MEMPGVYEEHTQVQEQDGLQANMVSMVIRVPVVHHILEICLPLTIKEQDINQ